MPLKQLERYRMKHIPEMDSLGTDSDEDPVRQLEEETKEVKPIVYGMYVVLLILGIVTGFILSRRPVTSGTTATVTETQDGKTAVGIADKQTFKDSATGTIEIGGLDGEGTHKLIRDGGPSQTVYLISSVVDLDQFEGKKVTVWGQTMGAKKAAWLMDVGKVEL